MIRTSLAISSVALVAALPAPAMAHYSPAGKMCGAIQFTPQSDHGSSDIRAKGTTCKTARKLVRAWERGNTSPLDFRCSARAHDPSDGLGHQDVVCKRGNRRVTWAAF